jgi:hypothetical protein
MGRKVRGVRAGSALIVDCPPGWVNLLRIADFRLVNLQGVSVKRHLFNWRLTRRAYKRMRRFLKNWLPVLLWLGVIFLGSTDLMSAEHTSRFIVPFLRWLKPDISPESLASIHFIVRKGAHLSEYASDVAFAPRRGLHDKSPTVDTDSLLECLGCLRICGCHGRISPNVRRVPRRFGQGHYDR